MPLRSAAASAFGGFALGDSACLGRLPPGVAVEPPVCFLRCVLDRLRLRSLQVALQRGGGDRRTRPPASSPTTCSIVYPRFCSAAISGHQVLHHGLLTQPSFRLRPLPAGCEAPAPSLLLSRACSSFGLSDSADVCVMAPDDLIERPTPDLSDGSQKTATSSSDCHRRAFAMLPPVRPHRFAMPPPLRSFGAAGNIRERPIDKRYVTNVHSRLLSPSGVSE